MSDLFASLLDNPIVGTAGTALGLAAVAMWLAAAWWAYRDAARRTESSLAGFLAAGWIVLSTPLLLPLSLAIYAFARPGTTAAEHRAQSLVAALSFDNVAGSTCSTCGAASEPGWRRCPQCATWLAAACPSCGEWAPAGLELCPFCGRDTEVLELDDLPEQLPEARPATAPAPAPIGVAAAGRIDIPRRGTATVAESAAASQLVASSRSQA
jgi:hypothetical protein